MAANSLTDIFKKWSLGLLFLNLGRLVTLQPMEYGRNATTWFPSLDQERLCLLKHSLWVPWSLGTKQPLRCFHAVKAEALRQARVDPSADSPIWAQLLCHSISGASCASEDVSKWFQIRLIQSLEATCLARWDPGRHGAEELSHCAQSILVTHRIREQDKTVGASCQVGPIACATIVSRNNKLVATVSDKGEAEQHGANPIAHFRSASQK